MKATKILTIAFAVCFAAIAMSFTMTSLNNEDIKFNETTHQFKQVPQGTPVTTEFTFTNASGKVLILKDVKASCGCTTPTYTQTPISDGQTGKITVTYNAANIGNFKKSVTVQTNISETPIILYIEGEVVAK